ncbi:hypothetical protein ABWI04_42720, partial [Actinomadura sp. NPDC000929]
MQDAADGQPAEFGPAAAAPRVEAASALARARTRGSDVLTQSTAFEERPLETRLRMTCQAGL